MSKKIKRSDELTYLQYFYENVQDALGPASDDVLYIIADSFEEETGMRPPKDYDEEE